jgi:hypothetical protein
VLALGAITTLGAVNFRAQFREGRYWLYQLNAEAVVHPPVPRASMPRGALIYFDSMEMPEWNLGDGHLFDFAYLDQSLTVRSFPEGGDSIEDAEAWLSAPHAYYFAYREQHWIDISSRYRASAIERLRARVPELVQARRFEEAKQAVRLLGGAPAALRCLDERLQAPDATECAALLGVVPFSAASPGQGIPRVPWLHLASPPTSAEPLRPPAAQLEFFGDPPHLYLAEPSGQTRPIWNNPGDLVLVHELETPGSAARPDDTFVFDGSEWHVRDDRSRSLGLRVSACGDRLAASPGAQFTCEQRMDLKGAYLRVQAKTAAEWLVFTQHLPPAFAQSPGLRLRAEVRGPSDVRMTLRYFDYQSGAYEVKRATSVGTGKWSELHLSGPLPSRDPEDYVEVGLAPAAAGASFDVRALELRPDAP